ncbi:MAG: transcriptional regulator KorA [Burkholderiales bacterium]|jgi:hypothetical protein|nr:transcriptional regulator KorA [Burkholderiales bacterium]
MARRQRQPSLKVDEATLERVAKTRRFDAQTIEMARRVLLHGERNTALANEYGLHPITIYRNVRAVRLACEAEWLPRGWTRRTIAAPTVMIRRFEREAMAAMREWQQSQAQKKKR